MKNTQKILDNLSKDTWKVNTLNKESITKEFRKRFVRDDGLLNIGKYDEEEVLDFIFEIINKTI